MGIMVMDSVPPATTTSCAAGRDAFGAQGYCLQPGRAEAVDGHTPRLRPAPGPQRRDAGDVHPLLGFGHGAAEDHVFDLFGIELRHPLERALDGVGREIIGPGGAEGSFVGFADRGSNGRPITTSRI